MSNNKPRATASPSETRSAQNLRNPKQKKSNPPHNPPMRDSRKDSKPQSHRGKTYDVNGTNLKENKQGIRGKKRDRDGKILETESSKISGHEKPISGNADSSSDEFDLEAEVQALGGTKEDLSLFANIDSGSEVEGSTTGDIQQDRAKTDERDIKKGVSNILREIALAQGSSVQDGDNVSSPVLSNGHHSTITVPKMNATNSASLSTHAQNRTNARLVLEVRPDWFNAVETDLHTEQQSHVKISSQSIDELHEYAKSLLNLENQNFENSQKASSSQSFYRTVITSGTLSDKISALTLAVQDSPLHNMKALGSLLSLARKRNRSQAVDVLRALKDLFAQGSLLPTNRKLYTFASQPHLLTTFGNLRSWIRGERLPFGVEGKHLLVWAFESWLKEQYFEVLQILETWSNDEIDFSKSRAINYVFELLKERPEQESNLLRLLINKLGDPVKKIASQSSYLLMRLLEAHPAMKAIVITTIQNDFMFKPSQSSHGQYFAVITLNQTVLSSKDEDIALKLLDTYFELFKGILRQHDANDEEPKQPQSKARRGTKMKKDSIDLGQTQKIELREKLTSAILTGVNRAYPYTGTGNVEFTQHLDMLFKIAHSSNFNTSIQALLLIQQISSSQQQPNDRFYRVLYESLLDPRLIGASKHRLYLNLLHRSLKADLNIKRVKAFVKRILQILSLHEPSFICGVFFLLRDLEKTFPALTTLLNNPEDQEDEEEVFRDVEEEDGVSNREKNTTEQQPPKFSSRVSYDAHKRAPEHANADNACAWELLPFLAHFHPSVSVSASHILENRKLQGKPDLTLYTLIHFLDRFVYRNPKLASTGLRGSSIMQPMAQEDSQAVLLGSVAGKTRNLPVNSERFKSQKDADVAAEDVFFHKYFSALGKDSTSKKAMKARKKSKTKDHTDSGSEGEEEDEIWKAMIDSAPQLEGEMDTDDDLDMSDLESDIDVDDHDDSDRSSSVDIEEGIFDDVNEDLNDEQGDDTTQDQNFTGFDGDEEFDDPDEMKQTEEPTSHTKSQSKQRRKGKNLPTFASAADYAKLLDNDEDEDLGA